jgi:serine/threonine-protein kinase
MPESLKPPEQLVAGKYRLVRLLGRGGMGTVWEGVHETLGTKVAVKFIDSEFASSEEVRQRFVNEAKAAARLRSKHVVQVYDQGVSGDGRPYIVMEWLGGEPLDVRLDRVSRLGATETAHVVIHVCRALAKAHAGGVVHRDLKPENVFLVHDDEDQKDIAKVVDFGIAKFVDAAVPGSSSTQTGAVLGTPQFMSPEQARGLRSVDHRTDLWSVGVIAYRCLTGDLPFKGEAMGDLLVNICTSDPPAPSAVFAGVPRGFDGWVKKALAREPAARFQSAQELGDSLAALCGVEVRIGAPLSSGRGATVVNPGVSAEVARALAADGVGATTPLLQDDGRGAITAQPFATTPPLSTPATRPLWIAGVVAIVVVSAIAARAVMNGQGEGTAISSPPAAQLPATAGTGAGREALHAPAASAPAPTVSIAPIPPAGSSDAPAAPSAEAADSRASGKSKPPAKPVKAGKAPPAAPKPAVQAAAPAPAKPARPADPLGY